MSKIIKKAADVYMTQNNAEIKLSIEFSGTLTLEEIFNNILYYINKYIRDEFKLKSIYFREEELKNE